MRTFALIIAALGLAFAAVAQEEELVPADLLEQAGDWLNENIDDDALNALGVDKERVQRFLGELHKQFQGTYLYDLSALRETAMQLQPVLAAFEETEPYALWLRTHMDYFEVSERLRKDAVARATNNRARPLPPPSAETQRSTWVKVIEQRPAPLGASRHVTRMKQIFAEEGVPPELAWIAEVESSFDPRAKSPAGAAGMFQLMPATARSLDLSVGLLRDERYDPQRSGRAAARYLRQLYGRFGDWRLAVAAYNCGPSRVAGLLKKHKGRSYDDIDAYLPVETQMYVPKVEATLRRRESVTLRNLKMPRG